MNIKSAQFDCSAPDLATCPDSDRPEIAFIGRSNVGKSSMINMLTNRKDLAKVSGTPGKTKLINFFTINDSWTLVDLPGYGYAKVAMRHRTEFNKAVAEYLEKRPNLLLVFVLIDCRLSPQKIDLEFIGWLAQQSVPFAFIFTKADKLKARPLAANISTFMESALEVCGVAPQTLVSSSKDRKGRSDILGFIEATRTAREAEEKALS
jgi:GTP-binding protein